jgi:hypothetical protein
VPKVGRTKSKEKQPRKHENWKTRKRSDGVLEKWSDGVLGLNQYSNTPSSLMS